MAKNQPTIAQLSLFLSTQSSGGYRVWQRRSPDILELHYCNKVNWVLTQAGGWGHNRQVQLQNMDWMMAFPAQI